MLCIYIYDCIREGKEINNINEPGSQTKLSTKLPTDKVALSCRGGLVLFEHYQKDKE